MWEETDEVVAVIMESVEVVAEEEVLEGVRINKFFMRPKWRLVLASFDVSIHKMLFLFFFLTTKRTAVSDQKSWCSTKIFWPFVWHIFYSPLGRPSVYCFPSPFFSFSVYFLRLTKTFEMTWRTITLFKKFGEFSENKDRFFFQQKKMGN